MYLNIEQQNKSHEFIKYIGGDLKQEGYKEAEKALLHISGIITWHY